MITVKIIARKSFIDEDVYVLAIEKRIYFLGMLLYVKIIGDKSIGNMRVYHDYLMHV